MIHFCIFILCAVNQSTSVPCWMFIGWISQIVALLDKEEGDVVAEILFKIADTYPQVFFYGNIIDD